MSTPAVRPDFGPFLQIQLDKHGFSHKVLGDAIGVTRQRVGKMIKDNRFPRACCAIICNLVKLPFNTVVGVNDNYKCHWYDPPREKSKTAQVEKLLKALTPRQRDPDAPVAEMLKVLSRPHAVIIKSQTVIPSPLIQSRVQTIAASYTGMDAGMLMAFFLPTQSHIERRLGTDPPLPHLERYEEFQSRFAEFRAGYLKRRESEGLSAEEHVNRHLQLFECDKFETVACGRVETLLIESDGRGCARRWVLERGPGSDGQVMLIRNNDENIERECVMTKWVFDKALAEKGCPPERQEFIRRALLRMLGKSEEEYRGR